MIAWQNIAGMAMVALIGCSIAIRGLRPHALRLDLVDRPGGRKQHARPTPTHGGLAVLLGLVLALSSGALLNAPALLSMDFTAVLPFLALAVGVSLLAGVGLIDDLHGIAGVPKLLAQMLAAAIVMAGGGLVISDLGQWPSGTLIALSWLAIPVTLLGIVGFVNALNMMDGVDGLAGGCVAVMLVWLALAAWLANLQGPWVVAVVTAAAVLGFLLYNLRGPWRAQASVFLGDAGSLSLGLIVIWLAIEISQAPSRVVSPMGIAWVVALPVFDTFSLLIRRLIHGQNPLKADRNHLHHLFGRAGFSPGQTAAALIVLSAALGGVGVLGSAIGVPDFVLGLGLLMVMGGHYLFVRYAWRTTWALKRFRASAGQLAPAERLGLVGLYAGMAGVALGEMALLGLAAASIAAASVVRFRSLIADLRAISMSWIAAGLLLWLTLAALRGPDFSGADWWPLLWASGVVALPLGWWFMRLRTHATGLFAVLLLSLIVAWGSSLEWRMLEAGFILTPAYWDNPRSEALLLGLVLMPLLAAIALSVGVAHRRWRARAALAFGVVLAGLTLLLLVASQSRVAIGAGALGLLAMVVGATLHRLGTRLWLGFISVSVAAVLMSSVLANTFKPPQVSLNAEYWAPVQSVLLLLANQPALAQDADPAVASQVATWQLAWQAIGERPLAGVGHLEAVGPSLGELAGERLSLYAIVGLVGGLTALALFLTLWLMALKALIGVVCARRWPLTQGFASYGVTAMIMGFLLLSPLVGTALTGLLLNGVLALGVAGALEARTQYRPPD